MGSTALVLGPGVNGTDHIHPHRAFIAGRVRQHTPDRKELSKTRAQRWRGRDLGQGVIKEGSVRR